MTPQETFINRLRRHRERNQISLDEVASETRIKREQLDAFERGDLTEWPRGIYARAWIRGYATVIGLDPIDTVDEFCRLFPQGDRRAGDTLRDFAAIIASPSTYRDEYEHMAETDRRTTSQPDLIPTQPTWREFLHRLVRNVRQARTARAVRAARTN